MKKNPVANSFSNELDTGWPFQNRILLSRVFVAIVAGLWALSTPAWHDASLPVAYCLAMLGVALATVGAFGRLWSSSYIAGNKNKRLVTDGPYSLCRNPLYFFTFLGGLGVVLTTETLTFPALFIAGFWAFYPGVIRTEEQSLRLLHGEAFDHYRRAVPAFWPSFRSYREPERYEISAVLFRRSLLEVLWFVAAAVMVHFIDDFHSAVNFAGWMKLY